MELTKPNVGCIRLSGPNVTSEGLQDTLCSMNEDGLEVSCIPSVVENYTLWQSFGYQLFMMFFFLVIRLPDTF